MPNIVEKSVSYARQAVGDKTAADTGDRIDWVKLSLVHLPLAVPVSDAKVLTGRQKPLTEIAFI
ncbi:MAG: hypothetical protein RLZZ401_371, partial [Pseudomonadota bacterium]